VGYFRNGHYDLVNSKKVKTTSTPFDARSEVGSSRSAYHPLRRGWRTAQ
jgi:hypothetical protein